ncbi:hypothetical protein [Microbulbifer thermotolerans]|uniref:hypothetical protein n=1 Tax=Microbulbifer thermotolerans TaxID=252514 RepID=UPI0012E79D93|nr:hypothetical protein [Microbulbifer thermotolerans]MCX2783648.1 hypothetical protein [Microbulbifer thermotolerans]MCX2835434.1 hypothetical protein [Microbulbifer thermotolerans]
MMPSKVNKARNATPAAFLFGIVGLQVVIGLQAFNPMSAKTWSRPNWRLNHFNFKQPLQFFHFGGWFMLVGSIPYLPEIIEGNQECLFLAAMPASFGLGILIGVRLSVLIFRKKFSHA